MSAESKLGISINISDPIVQGGRYLFSLTDAIASEQHETRAFGGYWSAEIALNVIGLDLEDWVENGLGRDVAIYDEAQQVIWAGFVNQITMRAGDLTLVRGPLLDIANKVRLVYSTADTTTTPPTLGNRTSTANAQNTDSQAKYGIIERVLGAGGVTAANATALRDTYIAENALPQTTQTLAVGGGGDVSITLSCLGYVHWLTAYIYSETTSGTQTATEKIQMALADDPNGIISTDYTLLTANALTMARYENDDRPAFDIIKAVVASGDSAAARWLFGIYGGRKARYEPAPTTFLYNYRMSEQGQVLTRNQRDVTPWSVRPGNWLFVEDLLTGRGTPAPLATDPRAIFIEAVQFTAPNGLIINGGKVSTLAQKLGRLGLSGIGA